ncbi:MAG: hypothetical protein AAF432_12825 [Planctomycetota bacterium]
MSSWIRTGIIAVALSAAVLLSVALVLRDMKQKTIDELRQLNAEMSERLVQHQAMIERLSRSRRVAHLRITDQATDDEGDVESTTVEFIELDDDGGELGRQTFIVPGEVLFVDAWTVKFEPADVAHGHPLRGRSLCLLRRIYSESLSAEDGFPIDTPGAVPPGYAVGDVSRFEQRLWEHFWTLATDWRAAQSMGVRVAQGEAVYKPVRAGQRYELVIDATGGMNLTPIGDDSPVLSRHDADEDIHPTPR